MITPEALLPLWTDHADALRHPVRTFDFPRFGRRFDDRPYQMGVVNLSPDSSYRESICHDLDAALYRARRMTLEGCVMIDIGAESTGVTADRVDVDGQIARMVPVVEKLAAENILVSVETYRPEVAEACLKAGAGIVNLTGRVDDPSFYGMVASHGAGLVLCYTPGENARSSDALPADDVLIDAQMDYFRTTLTVVERAGVERIWIDPGIGFYLRLPDGPDRLLFQTRFIMHSFRFRLLGWPVCVTMPSSVYTFRDEVRCAETCYATLALLAKANLIRSHEGARVEPVLAIARHFDAA